MALARNFKAFVNRPNEIGLNWKAPVGFNTTNDELIVTRCISHYPVELFNSTFPDRYTDNRPIEIFRGSTITGLNPATISVAGNILTDTAATFPTSPKLIGRLVRDINSKVYQILDNTSTSLTLSGNPVSGKYVILSDFVEDIYSQINFEIDSRTESGVGYIKNAVIFENGAFMIKLFEEDELANLIFRDGNGNKFIIKYNTTNTIYFFESSSIPVIGSGMAILNSHVSSTVIPYIDNFRTEQEASNRVGTELLDNKFYYYTLFTNEIAVNVAQAEYGAIDSGTSTQTFSISGKDSKFDTILYNYWPTVYKELDTSGDLEDLMKVFGTFFNELHSLIDTYKLQDSENVLVSALLPLSEQFGVPSIGFSIGADTLRRISRDMLSCWKLKGSKEGIALFIRIITTWDVTDGTGDISNSILDFLPNVQALRWFDPNLGNLNIRITQTDPFVSGGRFARSLPGIVIPGFFTFREFVITLPKVALYIGTSEDFTISSGTTTMTDTTQNFGSTNSLVGNYLLPNTEEINDIFQIVSNTSNSVTVRGIINNRTPGGDYAILSPLNASRFIILNKLLPVYIPFKTKAGFVFTI